MHFSTEIVVDNDLQDEIHSDFKYPESIKTSDQREEWNSMSELQRYDYERKLELEQYDIRGYVNSWTCDKFERCTV